jgi:hypothetical protein
MSRSLLTLISVVALVTSVRADETKPGSRLQADLRVPANTGLATSLSPDVEAVTLCLTTSTWIVDEKSYERFDARGGGVARSFKLKLKGAENGLVKKADDGPRQ